MITKDIEWYLAGEIFILDDVLVDGVMLKDIEGNYVFVDDLIFNKFFVKEA